jgi:hypothetical protein
MRRDSVSFHHLREIANVILEVHDALTLAGHISVVNSITDEVRCPAVIKDTEEVPDV